MNNTLPLVSFEQARILKAKGFDWPINEIYVLRTDNTVATTPFSGGYRNENADGNSLGEHWFSRPSLALCSQWLREVKGLHVLVEFDYETGLWAYNIQDINDMDNFERELHYDTHDTALSAGILNALKLIP